MAKRYKSTPMYKLNAVYDKAGKHTGWIKRIGGAPKWVCSSSVAPTPQAADEFFERNSKRLKKGQAVRRIAGVTTIGELAERWLEEREKDQAQGDIRHAHYTTCGKAVKRLLSSVGEDRVYTDLTPDDFTEFGRYLRRKLKAKALRRTVRIVLGFLRHCDEEDWIEQPIRVGKKFRKLANTADDAPRVNKFSTPDECRAILKAICDKYTALASVKERDVRSIVQLYAMVLLGLNGGYGGTDLAELPRDAVDLDAGVIDYRRGKTLKDRIVPLWPETIDALRVVLAKGAGDPLVFRTREGHPWVRERAKVNKKGQTVTLTIDNANGRLGKILRDAGLKRDGVGFYGLRHTHRTHTNDAGDETAADFVMGHTTGNSKRHYIHFAQTERGRQRLRDVVAYVRHAILNLPKTETPATTSRPDEPA